MRLKRAVGKMAMKPDLNAQQRQRTHHDKRTERCFIKPLLPASVECKRQTNRRDNLRR